jgi:hypothetical protein
MTSIGSINVVGENHYSLDNVFNDYNFPLVFAILDLILAEYLAR